jgi:hypothetical protein
MMKNTCENCIHLDEGNWTIKGPYPESKTITVRECSCPKNLPKIAEKHFIDCYLVARESCENFYPWGEKE